MFPAFTPGISNPRSSRGLHSSLFYKQLSWRSRKLSATESDTMGLGGPGSAKCRRTLQSIGWRNVLEIQRIQPAFRQTAPLLYSPLPRLLGEISFLADEERKQNTVFLLLLFLWITGCRRRKQPNVCAGTYGFCESFRNAIMEVVPEESLTLSDSWFCIIQCKCLTVMEEIT